MAASGPHVRRSCGSNNLVKKLRMEQHASLHRQSTSFIGEAVLGDILLGTDQIKRTLPSGMTS